MTKPAQPLSDALRALNQRHELAYAELLAQQEEQLQRARDREPEIQAGAASRFEARQQYRQNIERDQQFIARKHRQRQRRK